MNVWLLWEVQTYIQATGHPRSSTEWHAIASIVLGCLSIIDCILEWGDWINEMFTMSGWSIEYPRVGIISSNTRKLPYPDWLGPFSCMKYRSISAVSCIRWLPEVNCLFNIGWFQDCMVGSECFRHMYSRILLYMLKMLLTNHSVIDRDRKHHQNITGNIQ